MSETTTMVCARCGTVRTEQSMFHQAACLSEWVPASSPTPPAPGAPTPETVCVECGHTQEHHRGRNPKGHCTVCWQASVRELQQGYCRRFIAPQSLCATCPQPSLCTAKMLDGEHNVCELTALPPDIVTALEAWGKALLAVARNLDKSLDEVNAARARLDAAILRSLVTAKESAERLNAAQVELEAAAVEVNDRYIGGSPLTGRLGDALERLALARARVAHERRAVEG